MRAGVALILFCAPLPVAGAAEETGFPEQYERVTVLEVSAGEATSDVGFHIPTWEGDDWYGPSDFAIAPDGALYIADVWNRAIKRFSPDGAAEVLVSLGPRWSHDYYWAIAVTADRLYACSERELWGLNPRGQPQWRIAAEQLSASLVRTGSGTTDLVPVDLAPVGDTLAGASRLVFGVPGQHPLGVGPHGGALVVARMTRDSQVVLHFSRDGFLKGTARSCHVDREGRFYDLSGPWAPAPGGTMYKTILATEGREVGMRRIGITLPRDSRDRSSPRPNLYAWHVSGQGRLWGTGFYNPSPEWDKAHPGEPCPSVLRKYSPAGEALAEVEFPLARPWRTCRNVAFDEQGTPYALEFEGKLMRLVKWVRRQ
ncbi:MAG: hypothetical protein PVH68_20155 [Armatimonadota bacterium]|jgi:hypothetical protein